MSYFTLNPAVVKARNQCQKNIHYYNGIFHPAYMGAVHILHHTVWRRAVSRNITLYVREHGGGVTNNDVRQ